ncbi:hypothetical protein VP02_07640 [Pseudomonas ogarae]|uniref:Uncharacterized protein n=1 Tax=Pseudomonas kilonensis TaxID=132476 RepID=A0A0F4XRU6_9PSED|nr:hypothetical protein VP02_07640 [Pseudomonas ogarae]
MAGFAFVARELAPARLRSSRKPVAAVCLEDHVRSIWGGFATQREQAPSPQWAALYFQMYTG